jgi:uncharacterized lipoprotein YajG
MRRFMLLGTGVLLLFPIIGTMLLGCGGGATVGPAVSVKLTPTDVSLNRGATAQVTAQAFAGDNVGVSTPTLSYHSDNPAITVSNSGLICAGQWDANFIKCYTCSNPDLITNQCPANSALLPLGTANITATASTGNVTITSNTVVVTDHEPIDSIQVIPDLSNPTPCVSQAGTPPANTAKFTIQAFSNDPATCQRITGSSNVPCRVPNGTIGNINWAVSPTQVAAADATTKTAGDPLVVTSLVPGQGTVVGSTGISGSLVSGSAPFTTCAVASIHVQTSSGSNSFTAPVSSTVTLVPTVIDSQGNNLNLSASTLGLTWISSQPALASVSLGTVNTSAPGTAEITAACLPPSCNVNFTPPQPIYSDNAVTATITGTVDSTVLVATATAPASTSSSNVIVPIDTGTNNLGTAFTLPSNTQVNSMVLPPSGSPASLGTNCANGVTTGLNGIACAGLMQLNLASNTLSGPVPTITGKALVTDGSRLVVADPTINQISVVDVAGPSVEATLPINISSFIAPSGATEVGGTVTLSTTTPHGLSAGQSVLVAGVGVAGYNGVFTVASVPSSTTLTYTAAPGLTTPSGGGYVTGGVAAAIAPDGAKIYIAAAGKLYVYHSGQPPLPIGLSGTIDPTSSQAVSFFSTGAMAYVAVSDGDDLIAPFIPGSVPPNCTDAFQSVVGGGSPSHVAAVPNATAMVDANTPNIDEIDASSSGGCPPVITNSVTSHGFGVPSFTAKQLIVTPDSQLAIILTTDQGVLVYNLATKQTSQLMLTGGPPAPQPLSGGVTPDGADLYVGATDGRVHRINLSTLTDAQSISVNLCPGTTACNPDFLVVRPVAVVATLTSLAVTPVNPTVGVGATQQFTATGTFSDKSTRDMTDFVTWTSSNLVVAVIGPNLTVTPPITTTGLARALATGTTTISASSAGITGSTLLTVK